MKIEVLGSGCAKCNRLEKNVRQALRAIDGLDIIQAKTTLIRVEAESANSGHS